MTSSGTELPAVDLPDCRQDAAADPAVVRGEDLGVSRDRWAAAKIEDDARIAAGNRCNDALRAHYAGAAVPPPPRLAAAKQGGSLP